MRGGKIRTAVGKRICSGFAERGRAICRQRGQRNVPALVIDPLLEIAAGARYAEHITGVFQQPDVISKAAEAAQHDVFVARQLVARFARRLPFALQDRDIAEHFETGFG
jgi:hypothetical protein